VDIITDQKFKKLELLNPERISFLMLIFFNI